MAQRPLSIKDFRGGLNLTQDTSIDDNQFTILKNFYYNSSQQLETRRWYEKFGNAIGIDPITSYHFFQRDDNLTTQALCTTGTQMYKYNEWTTTWNSIKTGLTQFETIPELTTHRTRWDFAVYKNIVYLCNGVDTYASYNWTTYTEVGISSVGTVTFTNATDLVNRVAHWLVAGDEVRFTTAGTMPVWLVATQFYYVINANANDFQVSVTKWWTAVNFTTDGSGTITVSKITEPRIRYVSYLWDRLFGAWDDGNPISLYYTNAAPVDWTNINQNVVVVGWDENGRINWLAELGNIILAYKDQKVYSVDVANTVAQAIDAHNGGYADRTIANVANAIVYFTDKGIDTLQNRTGVTGSQALESKPLGDNVRALTDEVQEFQFNSGTAWYNKAYNNYYISFDTDDNNIPDTTLVYSTLTKGWSEYTYPPLYDYGYYINSDQEYQYLFASGITGQMYRMEYGFTDDGVSIPYELETKRYDFGTPWLNKTYDYIDVIGYASLGTEIEIQAKVDWGVVAASFITNANLDIDSVSKTLWSVPIGTQWLTGDSLGEWIDLYRYTFRLPMYAMGWDISFNMSSEWGVWILEQARVSKDDQPVELFNYANIG